MQCNEQTCRCVVLFALFDRPRPDLRWGLIVRCMRTVPAVRRAAWRTASAFLRIYWPIGGNIMLTKGLSLEVGARGVEKQHHDGH